MKLLSTILMLLVVFSSYGFAQKSLSPEYLKRIKDATPQPLPQAPGARKQTSDAQDERLKAKVKSVFEERADVIGTAKIGEREASEMFEFDERGNFLRKISFDWQGRPDDVVVYGYIDGVRASLYGFIEYGDELIVVGRRNEKTTQEKPKPDKRFTYKYEYKFSAGKMSEMLMIRNTGERGMRYTYDLNAGQLVKLAYTDEDQLNQKYVSKLDEKGNEIEMTSFNVSQGTIYGTYRYKYESFDKHGNWTKRTESKLVLKDGNELYEPYAVKYRTISYYR